MSAVKFFAGIFGNSSALVSDSIQSASDVFSNLIVVIGVKFSAKKSDKKHPYGHERYESVAAIILSVLLLVTALFIGNSSIQQIFSEDASVFVVPGTLALIVSVFSIVCKEGLYHFTKYYAKRLDSVALRGIAWDHRSDVLSGLCVLIGIAGSILGLPILDKIANLVICLFIIKASISIFYDAIKKMIDHSCPEETEKQIELCALSQDGVLSVDLIQTRMFGNKIYVDIEICADANITLAESHEIAENVHNAIESSFEKVKHIMVHVNPSDLNA